MKTLFPEMDAEIREDRTAAKRELVQRHRDFLVKRDLAWLIDYLVDHGPQSEVALSLWMHDQNFSDAEFTKHNIDIHLGLESLWRVGKVWRKSNGIHPGTGYPSFVYGLRGVHPQNNQDEHCS